MAEQYLDENIISTDAGNGWAACYRLVNGKVKAHGIPHVRARVVGDKLNDDLTNQARYDFADFMGERYGYGDGIWNYSGMPIDTHQNTERRYGSPMHIFLILVNLAEMNVKSGSAVTLVVPAPPGLFNKVAPTIKQSLLAGEDGSGNGVWTIRLNADKKPRTYTVKRVIVLPEGAGAYAAYRFNINGDVVALPDKNGDDLLAGRVEVLDLGAGTGDMMTVIDGNVNPENISSSSDDRAGVIYNILRPLLNDIVQKVPEATHLRTVHIDAYLRKYVTSPTTENATVRISGKTINIEQRILEQCKNYAEWIAANKLDAIWGAGADTVLMAGGGWLYIASFIKEWYPNRNVLSPDMYRHTRGIPLYDLNGVGQLNLTAAVLKAQQV